MFKRKRKRISSAITFNSKPKIAIFLHLIPHQKYINHGDGDEESIKLALT